MDRQTLEIVYQEIDARIDIMERQLPDNVRKPLYIEMFTNLKSRLQDLENEYLEQMAADYEQEEADYYNEKAEEHEWKKDTQG